MTTENTTENTHVLYNIALAADDAWQAELESVYGSNAVDARYDSRGIATPQLAAVKAAFRAATWDASRAQYEQRRSTTAA